MSKGLESLSDLRLGYCGNDEQKQRAYSIIEKELEVIELLKTRGIGLIIPNNDLSEEHIDIQVFTKSLSAKELELIKEILL